MKRSTEEDDDEDPRLLRGRLKDLRIRKERKRKRKSREGNEKKKKKKRGKLHQAATRTGADQEHHGGSFPHLDAPEEKERKRKKKRKSSMRRTESWKENTKKERKKERKSDLGGVDRLAETGGRER